MTTGKAPSKDAMEAIRAVRCSHEPVNCDFCVAAALEAFAATVNNHIRMTYESEHALAEAFKADRDALRERHRALVEALQRISDGDEWGNTGPLMRLAHHALAADAEAGEDAHG